MTYELTQLLLESIQHVENSIWIWGSILLLLSSVYLNHLSNKIDNTSEKLDQILSEKYMERAVNEIMEALAQRKAEEEETE